MIESRVLTPDDWPLWRTLRLAALAQAPYAFGSKLADWQGEGDKEERWRARLAIPDSHTVAVFLDGEPTGIGSGIPGPADGIVEVISVWVSPAARGRGVGDALLESIEQWARTRSAHLLRLAVIPSNAAATGLYRRNGFVLTDESGDLMDDGVTREAIMEKRLQ
jgi:ribosomal protein S18 acetylase RimI-like enzyme